MAITSSPRRFQRAVCTGCSQNSLFSGLIGSFRFHIRILSNTHVMISHVPTTLLPALCSSFISVFSFASPRFRFLVRHYPPKSIFIGITHYTTSDARQSSMLPTLASSRHSLSYVFSCPTAVTPGVLECYLME
ncbi:uncharacterized protein BJ212DRAFT_456155 [Suillus subaureus]|uniref:Uncharacterized protein n=1 Tax=Suillus subaureus TaxID=48587 RepID=A0A9P7JBC7_9AGAM|nr:uncharacterized protein BJ212DRAFT_456155 [Suillus subaureus]KAG1812530.1 hypothetical protein BJ212DRAFT_456155 [Suillus subaureus]